MNSDESNHASGHSPAHSSDGMMMGMNSMIMSDLANIKSRMSSVLNIPRESSPGLFTRQLSQREKVEIAEESRSKDPYATNKEPFPEFINVALFSRSDDEYLERLIDKALIKVCYSEQFEGLWKNRK